MKIIVYRIPCINDEKGFRILEEKKELMPEKEEKVKDTDHMKVLAGVNEYNMKQVNVSEIMPGESFIFRKLIVE